MDICFVGVPFAPIERPLISFGLLQERLKNNNIKAKTLYPNLDFACRIGIQEYYNISQIGSSFAFGDWVFSKYLFPENDPDLFLNFLNKYIGKSVFIDSVMKSGFIGNLQDEAFQFIEQTASSIVQNYNPAIVACSSMFDNHVACLSLLKCIKKISPDTITLMGGANCEGDMGISNHKLFNFIDYIVSGHADHLISDLVSKILKSGNNLELSEVPKQVIAPVFRKNGYQNISSHIKPINEKIKSTTPDYSDYFNKISQSEKLKRNIFPTIPIETSRGCYWGKCKFCGLNGHSVKYTQKQPEEILNEINVLSDKYDTKKIEFVDNAINVSSFIKIAKRFEKKDFKYFAEIRTDIKKENLETLRDSGFAWVQPGIENLNDKFLKCMNKGTNTLDNIQIMKWSRQYGIHIIWSIMHYFPKEENEWYNELIEIIPKLGHLYPPKGMNKLRYDRFSHYYQNQKKYDLNLQACEYYNYIYPFEQEVLGTIVYFFEDKKEYEIRQNPLLYYLIGEHKPSIGKLNQLIEEWIGNFTNDEIHQLYYTINNNGNAIIKDTRKISSKQDYLLNELETKIIVYCDKYKSIEQVYEHLKDNYSIVEINRAIIYLLDKNLMIKLNEQIITIALEYIPSRLADNDEFACGVVLKQEIKECIQ